MDANGRQLGTVVGATPVVFVALIVNGNDIVVSVPLSSFFESNGIKFVPIHGSADLIFETPDCTGAPFLPSYDWLLTKPVAVVQPGMVVYVPKDSSAPTTMTRRSMLDGFGRCYRIEEVFVSEVSAWSAVAIADLATVFTPPFRLVGVPASARGRDSR